MSPVRAATASACSARQGRRHAEPARAARTPQVCINAAGTGGCTAAPALGQIGTLVGAVVYKTNRFAYAAGTGGVASFARNKTSLVLTPLAAPAACTTETGNGGACLAGKGIGG